MAISNIHITHSFARTNNIKLVLVSIVLIYFAWMDIALYMNLQRWSPPPLYAIETNGNLRQHSNHDFDASVVDPYHPSRLAESRRQNRSKIIAQRQPPMPPQPIEQPFTVFNPLSVKLIMVDHVTHYVHDVVARFIEDNLHLSSMFSFITPNFVSFFGLLLAFIGCSLIALSNDPAHARLGAILFELRNLADSLDGVVYRSQARQRRIEMMMQQQQLQLNNELTTSSNNNVPRSAEVYQSNYGSSGYNVDMICDGLGGLFFVLAIFVKYSRLQTYFRPHERVLSDEIELLKPSSSSTSSSSAGSLNSPSSTIITIPQLTHHHHRSIARYFSFRQVELIIIAFGLRLLFTGLIWDHFVHKYHDLLMVLSTNPKQRMLQIQAFKSISMWLVMWFWRLGNACAILEHLAISTFFNKLWDYLVFTNYIGWAYLIIMTMITQMHYLELYESLNSASAFT